MIKNWAIRDELFERNVCSVKFFTKNYAFLRIIILS